MHARRGLAGRVPRLKEAAMRELYEFAVGPLAWGAFAVFFLGSIARLVAMYSLAKKKDAPFLSYMSWRYGLRSIGHWLVPFGSLGWKENPALTVVTFIFHICLIVTPIFLLAHVVLLDLYHGIEYPTLPEAVTDVMTMLVVAACIFFAARRFFNRTVRYVTSTQDWIVLAVVFLPFATGLLAYHQVGPPLTMATLHILSAELMLVAIPFTRLSHMIFGLFTRAYMGSEFGGIRHAKDW